MGGTRRIEPPDRAGCNGSHKEPKERKWSARTSGARQPRALSHRWGWRDHVLETRTDPRVARTAASAEERLIAEAITRLHPATTTVKPRAKCGSTEPTISSNMEILLPE
jgi:hypothetical protein